MLHFPEAQQVARQVRKPAEIGLLAKHFLSEQLRSQS